MMHSSPAPARRWDDHVDRVVIQVTNYLDFEGNYWAGGRQRHVLDLALVIRQQWGRDVVVVQKAKRAFESTCPAGIPVVGLRCDTSSLGDPILGYMTRRMIRARDGLIYAAGEDAWPFFSPGAKAVQHGVWWDGALPVAKRALQRRRLMSMCRSVSSLLCVDTNFINWLRCQGAEGLELCNRCVYVPNYADTDRLPPGDPNRPIGDPVRLLFARRFEPKRGIFLFINALTVLAARGYSFFADICTIGGRAEIQQLLAHAGLSAYAAVSEQTMDSVLDRYASADIAIIPTLWSEGTSLSCAEAICAGVPVVATPVGGLGNIVVPNFNGMLVAPTAEALASGIEAVSHADRWTSLRKNCLAMRDSLSRDRWCAEVIGWLKS